MLDMTTASAVPADLPVHPVLLDPSHVLLAIGLPHEIAHGSLRLTLSAEIYHGGH